jgi:uncharacterized membrane protein (UPF0127 family)
VNPAEVDDLHRAKGKNEMLCLMRSRTTREIGKITVITNPLVLICVATALYLPFFVGSCGPSEFTKVTFPSGQSVKCEIADSPKKLVAGLTTYDNLPENRGMIFVYPQERTNLSFWMPQRMRFSVDMIFLNKEKRVVHIVHNAQPCDSNIPEDCPSYGPEGRPAQYVVEVVAGFCERIGLKLDDTLKFTLP